MSVLVDTSALLGIVDADDDFHSAANKIWIDLLDSETRLFTTNYVLLETTALLQKRLGLKAVRLLAQDILPVVETIWITRERHHLSVSTLLTANRRQLSLVDLTSFAVMRERGIESAFTFDSHFKEQGFALVG